jgi:molybdopterin-guanine dinucleotide biosynthesis protein A
LAAALTNLRAPHLLALAVDLPWMRSRHLAQLLTMRRPGVGVAPVMDGRFEPLCAIYPREAGLAANEALARDERALQILVRRLVEAGQMQTYAVPAAERALYRNLNSPADF